MQSNMQRSTADIPSQMYGNALLAGQPTAGRLHSGPPSTITVVGKRRNMRQRNSLLQSMYLCMKKGRLLLFIYLTKTQLRFPRWWNRQYVITCFLFAMKRNCQFLCKLFHPLKLQLDILRNTCGT